MDAVLYIHGKGGSAIESEHYKELFPGCRVTGLDYKTFTPWETGKEIHSAVSSLKERYGGIMIVANSIGAFFCMNAGIEKLIEKAFFISPVVDMEKLICGMMDRANVTEDELKTKKIIPVPFGDDLSWEYLTYVRENPVKWNVPTEILYGGNDALTSYETVMTFAKNHNANVTVMKGGEHWFHTEKQMSFLDEWIKANRFSVRALKESETGAALCLALKVFTEYEAPVYQPEGTEEFKKTLKDGKYLSGIVYYGAFYGSELIGVLGVRKEKRHICFFFVDGRFHRMGAGTRLFMLMMQDIGEEKITLNSSPYGLPFYKKLGFAETDKEQTVNGIRFTPMEYKRKETR